MRAQYTGPTDVIARLVEDAYKNLYKDAVIKTLQEQHANDSVYAEMQYQNFKAMVVDERRLNSNLQNQLATTNMKLSDVGSERDVYKKSSRRYRKQRNVIAVFVVLVGGAAIVKK